MSSWAPWEKGKEGSSILTLTVMRISTFPSFYFSALKCPFYVKVTILPFNPLNILIIAILKSVSTFFHNMVMYFVAVFLAGGSLFGIIYSYSKIVFCIHEISSAQGKYKAFSTCASHLSVVSLFYCTGLGVYLSSAATHGSHSSATASVMYTVVTPMLNPFIYSLRNKDIKRFLRRFFGMVAIKGPIVLGLKKCQLLQH